MQPPAKAVGLLGVFEGENRLLFIQNFTSQTNLALTGSLENKIGTLEWFLKELEQDIRNLQNSQEDGEQKRARGRFTYLPKVLERIVEESLQRLREHNQVSFVYYMSSQMRFFPECPRRT